MSSVLDTLDCATLIALDVSAFFPPKTCFIRVTMFDTLFQRGLEVSYFFGTSDDALCLKLRILFLPRTK
jgi:hypothetical protein